jgi:hypothetical protein
MGPGRGGRDISTMAQATSASRSTTSSASQSGKRKPRRSSFSVTAFSGSTHPARAASRSASATSRKCSFTPPKRTVAP